MAKGFNDVKGSNDKSPRIEELVDVYSIPDNTWVEVRFMDTGILPVARHWIEIEKKDGSGRTRFPKLCLSWNPETEEHDEDKECPYCNAGIDASVSYYANAIIREDQEERPENPRKGSPSEIESGFKEKGSKAWTPVKVLSLQQTFISLLKDLSDINKHPDEKGVKRKHDVSSSKYGMDVRLRISSELKGAAKFSVTGGDQKPLNKEERKYLIWNLDGISLLKRMGLETVTKAKAELARIPGIGKKARGSDYDVSDDDEDAMLNGGKRKPRDYDDYDDRPKGKKGKQERYEDYDDDEPAPPRKSAKARDEYDDDDAPTPRKGRSYDDDDEPPKKPKKAPPKDEYDDEDEPAPPKKPKSKFSYDDDDDRPRKSSRYDDEDEPAPPKKPKKARVEYDDEPAPPRKSAKARDEYDDDDEPAPPKKPKKAPPKDEYDDDDSYYSEDDD